MKTYNVCFLGRTGNGKSSLINCLFGCNFSTDPLVSCTKEMYTVTVLNDELLDADAITVYDTPGIGEFSSDSKYEKYYQHAVSVANCVVLVLTLERVDAPPQRLMLRMRQYLNPDNNTKFVIALNYIDSCSVRDTNGDYSTWDDVNNIPTELCRENVRTRIEEIKKSMKDKFLPFDVIPVCAKRTYGIEDLFKAII